MGLMIWLRGITGSAQGTGPGAPDSTPSAPLSPRLEQERRIHLKAEQYRRQFRAEAAARAAAEAQQERDRLERAQREYEDDAAFGLAMGWGYFPQDRHGGAGPQLLSLGEWAQRSPGVDYIDRDRQ